MGGYFPLGKDKRTLAGWPVWWSQCATDILDLRIKPCMGCFQPWFLCAESSPGKPSYKIHVHPREDLERVRMAQLTSVLLLTKAMCYLQWGSEKLADTRAAPRGLAWYCHLLATEEFPPWLLEASGFFEEILLTYPSVLRPCLIKWDLVILWGGVVLWKVLWDQTDWSFNPISVTCWLFD